jgi:hypothetical protein
MNSSMSLDSIITIIFLIYHYNRIYCVVGKIHKCLEINDFELMTMTMYCSTVIIKSQRRIVYTVA